MSVAKGKKAKEEKCQKGELEGEGGGKLPEWVITDYNIKTSKKEQHYRHS